MGLTVIGVMAMIAALTALPGSAQAHDDAPESTAELRLSVSEVEPGDSVTVRGSNFRVGTEASFIYTSTITVGGVPIDSVASVDLASGYLHAARTTESGLHIAEHIDIDPANTTPDGAFIAEFLLPHDLPAGDHDLQVTSCWGGPDDAYPEDGVAPCGVEGLGGGVNDRIVTASITITEPADSSSTSGGVDASEPAGLVGPRGTEGPPGPPGSVGPTGPAGSTSPVGIIALIVAIVAVVGVVGVYILGTRHVGGRSQG